MTVTPYLQVAGQDRVFALGDVAAADYKMAGIAGRHAQVVAASIRALIAGDDPLTEYEPMAPGIIVPIGPDGGSGQRPDVAELVAPEVVAPEVVAQLKGRDRMVDRFATMFQPAASGDAGKDGS